MLQFPWASLPAPPVPAVDVTPSSPGAGLGPSRGQLLARAAAASPEASELSDGPATDGEGVRGRYVHGNGMGGAEGGEGRWRRPRSAHAHVGLGFATHRRVEMPEGGVERGAESGGAGVGVGVGVGGVLGRASPRASPSPSPTPLNAGATLGAGKAGFKRAARKLSFTAPMFGLVRRDKERERDRDKEREREKEERKEREREKEERREREREKEERHEREKQERREREKEEMKKKRVSRSPPSAFANAASVAAALR